VEGDVKVIGDLDRWLKSAGKDWQMTLYVTRNEITVAIDKTGNDGVVAKSRTLEGALENALEELRRKENGAESMRTEKTTNVPGALTIGTFNSTLAALKQWRVGTAMLPPPIVHSPPTVVMTYACGIHGYFGSVNGSTCPKCPPVPKP
jgi:hypothetical protein